MPKYTENIEVLWPGTPTNFPRIWLGHDSDHLMYFFHQPRPGSDEFWSGWESFKRPPPGIPVSYGYGYYPGRQWNQHFLQEAGGEVMTRSLMAERFVLMKPHYRDMQALPQQFVEPAYYDENGIPYKANGERLGGIHFIGVAQDTYWELTTDGDIRFVSRQVPEGITLSQIAQALRQLGIT